jgi:NarL family two-component system response regulator LiaR
MFVDDHALVRAAVRQALVAGGMDVVAEASTAEEAVLVAPRVRPDVMLIDIDLPGLDGLALIRELGPRIPETRFLVLTVSGDDDDVVDAIRNGASGYLTKDLAPDALVRSVNAAMRDELVVPRAMGARLVRNLVRQTKRSRHPEEDPQASLTDREADVLRLLARGLTDREIAEALVISPRTVGTHVSSILHKLGARNRAEAVARYPRRS